MTPQQIDLVQTTFRAVAVDPEALARLFYDELFAIDPTLRLMFPEDMNGQGKKLVAVLRMVVAGLDRLGDLLPAIRELAVRHVGYRVERQHYDLVGEALLTALRNGLGAGFTAEVATAWATAYGVLAGAMIAAAYPAKAA